MEYGTGPPTGVMDYLQAKQPELLDYPLRITCPLRTEVSRCGLDVTFECKALGFPLPTATWYKNGVPTTPRNEAAITSIENYMSTSYTVTNIQPSDAGVYAIVLENRNHKVTSWARLDVAEDNLNQCGALYYSAEPRQLFQVSRHLAPAVSRNGDTVNLKAVFAAEPIEFQWFRNNLPIDERDGIEIIRSKGYISLTIRNVKDVDSGVYSLVVRVGVGYITSTAVVLVLDSYPINVVAPYIIKILRKNINADEGEEVNFVVKCFMRGENLIRWQRNLTDIEHLHQYIDYGDGYQCLNLELTDIISNGKYSLNLTDGREGRSANAEVTLQMRFGYAIEGRRPQVTASLNSVVAQVGAKVMFHCQFALTERYNYFAVWRVAYHLIERSNPKFRVICHSGDFFLYIPLVDPSMAGEVVCELRRADRFPDSDYLNRSLAHLAIVPLSIMRQALHAGSTYDSGEVFWPAPLEDLHPINGAHSSSRPDAQWSSSQDAHSSSRPDAHSSSQPEAHCSSRPDIPCFSTPEASFTPNMVLPGKYSLCRWSSLFQTGCTIYITFCRLIDGFCHLKARRQHNELQDYVSAIELGVHSQNGLPPLLVNVIIRWDNPEVPEDGIYNLELANLDGVFMQVGITNQRTFLLRNVPLETVCKIRIRALAPLMMEKSLTIIDLDTHNPNSYSDWKFVARDYIGRKSYLGDKRLLIGLGSYGLVQLVETANRVCTRVVAKLVEVKNDRVHHLVIRECAILRVLKHPKIVQLYHTQAKHKEMILYMEYCWGGELSNRIASDPSIAEVDIVPYIRQICQGLQYLHSKMIVHLDIKPNNIVCQSRNNDLIKIIDFGFAQSFSPKRCSPHTYGTGSYASPETLTHKTMSGACDMWSVGVLTYQLFMHRQGSFIEHVGVQSDYKPMERFKLSKEPT